jgi:histidyl-tRNA synthetase
MDVISLLTSSFFKRSASVAEHYGFSNTQSLFPEEHSFSHGPLPKDALSHGHMNSLLRYYQKTPNYKARQPLLFYTPTLVSHPSEPQNRFSALSLSAMGVYDPLTEFTLLKTALGILDEFGIKKNTIRINSMGDSDSVQRFMRDTEKKMKEKQNQMCKEHICAFRKNPYGTISELFIQNHNSIKDFPGPIHFLTTPSRKYFRELISLFEYAGLPIKLDDRLYGDHSMYAHTLYEIETIRKSDSSPILVARGGRYDPLTKKHIKNTIPSAGISLIFKTNDTFLISPQKKRQRKPYACIVHIGREAHIKSIALVDQFRKVKIPITHCFHLERLSDQMDFVHKQNPKFVLIIGQKEAIENVALVRNTENCAQTTIPLQSISHYLQEQRK